MSLRREVHSAFDVIAPPLGGMPERVVQTVLADQKARGRKRRMLLRLRAPLSLVAVFLLIALVAAVFIGGRLVQDWNAFRKPVSAAPATTQVDAELAARKVILPSVGSPSSCPDKPGSNTHGFDYGDGPVYGNGGQETTTSWGYFWDVAYFTAPGLRGPVLLRGRDLMTGKAQVFVGPQATGPVAGTDSSQHPPALRTEMFIDPANPPSRSNGFGVFPVRQGLPKDYVGCFGIQIDGSDFTETITGWVAP